MPLIVRSWAESHRRSLRTQSRHAMNSRKTQARRRIIRTDNWLFSGMARVFRAGRHNGTVALSGAVRAEPLTTPVTRAKL